MSVDNKTPAELKPGVASRGSTVHASDLVENNFSRGHKEEDISRIQSAVHLYSTKSFPYKVGDLVKYHDSFYRNLKAIITPEDFDPTKWEKISGGGGNTVPPVDLPPGEASRDSTLHASDSAHENQSKGHKEEDVSRLQSAINDYNNKLTYKVGDLVNHENKNYRNKTTITTPEPFDVTKWEIIGGGGNSSQSAIFDYSNKLTYKVGDLVKQINLFYRNKTAITSPEEFTFSKWEYVGILPKYLNTQNANRSSLVHASDANHSQSSTAHYEGDISRLQSAIHNYADNLAYKVGDLVKHSDLFYRNKTAITTPETFDPAKWEKIGGGGTSRSQSTINDYSDKLTYKVNDIVRQIHNEDNAFFINIKAITTPERFQRAKWELIVKPPAGIKAGKPVRGSVVHASAKNELWQSRAHKEEDISRLQSAINDFSNKLPYLAGDLVKHDGRFYRNIKQYVDPRNFDPTRWELIDGGGTTRNQSAINDYDNKLKYKVGDLVKQINLFYRNKTAVISPGPFNPAKWEYVGINITALTSGPANRGSLVHVHDAEYNVPRGHREEDVSRLQSAINNYNNELPYKVGDLVNHENKNYRNKTTITTPETFDVTKWEKIGGGDGTSRQQSAVLDYDNKLTYKVGDLVKHSDLFYRNKTAITTPEDFKFANWEYVGINITALTSGPAVRGSLVHVHDAKHKVPRGHLEEDISRLQSAIHTHTSKRSYKVGDLVEYRRSIYRCIRSHTSEIFNNTFWTNITTQSTILACSYADMHPPQRYYFSITGGYRNFSDNPRPVQTPIPYKGYISTHMLSVSVNLKRKNTDWFIVINGSHAPNELIIARGTTGVFSSTVSTTNVVQPFDQICYQIILGGDSGDFVTNGSSMDYVRIP